MNAIGLKPSASFWAGFRDCTIERASATRLNKKTGRKVGIGNMFCEVVRNFWDRMIERASWDAEEEERGWRVLWEVGRESIMH